MNLDCSIAKSSGTYLYLLGLLLFKMCCESQARNIFPRSILDIPERRCDPAYCFSNGECFFTPGSLSHRYCKCKTTHVGSRCSRLSLNIRCLSYYIDASENGETVVNLPIECRSQFPSSTATTTSTTVSPATIDSVPPVSPTTGSTAAASSTSTPPSTGGSTSTSSSIATNSFASNTQASTPGTGDQGQSSPGNQVLSSSDLTMTNPSSPFPNDESAMVSSTTQRMPSTTQSRSTTVPSVSTRSPRPTSKICRQVKKICRKSAQTKKQRRMCKCVCEISRPKCRKLHKKRKSSQSSRNLNSREASMANPEVSFRFRRSSVSQHSQGIKEIVKLLTQDQDTIFARS